MSAGLLERATMLSAWLSLADPELIPLRNTVCSPASSLRVRLLIALRVGGSLTGVTVMLTVPVAYRLPSKTVKLKLSRPL